MATDVLPDEARLLQSRRDRAFAQMEGHDVDVLLLGREANARYISGAPRLWTAGTRPYGPGCVVVRSTRAIHLVSTWDEGMPDDIPHENLFGITWNPGNLFAWLQGIEGVSAASRIGTDSLTPRFGQMLPKLFPSAEFMDAEPLLSAARRIKTPEEMEALGLAASVTETALAAAIDALRPGITTRHLTAVFMETMAAQGVTTPATQRVAWVSRGPLPSCPTWVEEEIGPDDLVAFDAGVVAGGYMAEVGRTWPADSDRVSSDTTLLVQKSNDLWAALLAACQPGASCTGLLQAYTSVGQGAPPLPVAFGLGLGFDVPVVSAHLPQTAAQDHLEAGMVLAVTAQVDDGARSILRKEIVHIEETGPVILSTSPLWRA
ncbi:MAG TPA: M24 family metallopeptidase [Acidimicrobiales bacterium]|jgi:Xaa-Pro aminopeptidase|nr:M24 family metallopeptidase [Acidimicrobiales bacterium]